MADGESGVSKPVRIAGWVLGVLPAIMLVFSAVMKLLRRPEVVEGFAHLGMPERFIVPLGAVELASAVLYLIPQTAVLGAILLTGYLGGAIATHLRLAEPFVVQALLGVVLWLGLYLRDRRVRALIPLRR